MCLCLQLAGEALTQSSLLEADGANGDGMVTMTTGVEPMNLHHAMLRSPGWCLHGCDRADTMCGEVDKVIGVNTHSVELDVLLTSEMLIQLDD